MGVLTSLKRRMRAGQGRVARPKPASISGQLQRVAQQRWAWTLACLDPAVHTHVVHVVGGGELLAAQRVRPGEVELLQAGLEKNPGFFLKNPAQWFFLVFSFFCFFLVFLYICLEFLGFFQFQE
jgi:hypothetical protein